eukprot:76062_1
MVDSMPSRKERLRLRNITRDDFNATRVSVRICNKSNFGSRQKPASKCSKQSHTNRENKKVMQQYSNWYRNNQHRPRMRVKNIKKEIRKKNNDKKLHMKARKRERKLAKKRANVLKWNEKNKTKMESIQLKNGNYRKFINKSINPLKLKLRDSKEKTISKNGCECGSNNNGICTNNKCSNGSEKCECNESICSSNKLLCENRHIQKGNFCCVEVAQTKVKGWGLFAVENNIEQGEFIIEYKGEVISKEEKTRRWNLNNNRYMFQLQKRFWCDGWRCSNEAAMSNHSCNANMESELWECNKKIHIILKAKRDITIGEELTLDYGCDYDVERFECDSQNKKDCRYHKNKK